MKGIHVGSLCLVLPHGRPCDWDWALVKVTKDRGILHDSRVHFSGDHWWEIHAEDGVTRDVAPEPGDVRKGLDVLMPGTLLMPIDPLNDAARERAMSKPVAA